MPNDTFAYEEQRDELNRLFDLADDLQTKYDFAASKHHKFQLLKLSAFSAFVFCMFMALALALMPFYAGSNSFSLANYFAIVSLALSLYSIVLYLSVNRRSMMISRDAHREARALRSVVIILHEYSENISGMYQLSAIKQAEFKIRLSQFEFSPHSDLT